jgi:anti-sigma B factor antagonist
LRIEIKFAGEIPILKLSGRFVAGGDGPFLRKKVSDFIDAGSRKLVVDMEEVPYLDSTGLGFLAGSQKVAQLAGAKIVLASLNEHVLKVLETAQLSQFFAIAANEEDALRILAAVPDPARERELAPAAPAAATPAPAPAKPARGRKRSAAPRPAE